jgi:hypothetical protein
MSLTITQYTNLEDFTAEQIRRWIEANKPEIQLPGRIHKKRLLNILISKIDFDDDEKIDDAYITDIEDNKTFRLVKFIFDNREDIEKGMLKIVKDNVDRHKEGDKPIGNNSAGDLVEEAVAKYFLDYLNRKIGIDGTGNKKITPEIRNKVFGLNPNRVITAKSLESRDKGAKAFDDGRFGIISNTGKVLKELITWDTKSHKIQQYIKDEKTGEYVISNKETQGNLISYHNLLKNINRQHFYITAYYKDRGKGLKEKIIKPEYDEVKIHHWREMDWGKGEPNTIDYQTAANQFVASKTAIKNSLVSDKMLTADEMVKRVEKGYEKAWTKKLKKIIGRFSDEARKNVIEALKKDEELAEDIGEDLDEDLKDLDVEKIKKKLFERMRAFDIKEIPVPEQARQGKEEAIRQIAAMELTLTEAEGRLTEERISAQAELLTQEAIQQARVAEFNRLRREDIEEELEQLSLIYADEDTDPLIRGYLTNRIDKLNQEHNFLSSS